MTFVVRAPAARRTERQAHQASPPEHLAEFCSGLRAVLLAGDVEAFRRYLRRWEELIGDTSELAETSDEQARRTMATLLRRPAQFGLPPWTQGAIPPPGELHSPDDSELAASDVVGQEPLPTPLDGESPEASPPEPLKDADAIYQLDMLTGELVPRDPLALRPPAETVPARAPRPRKRRLPPNVAQLPLLPLWTESSTA